MGAKEFGQLVADRMDELGWSQNKVARRFGELPDGRGLDSSQVRVIKEGGRRLDHALVERLIHVLGLDENPTAELRAWATAGLWPEDLNPEDITDLSELLATRRMTAAGRVASPRGGRVAAPQLTSDQGEPETLYLRHRLERPAA
jgi:hypothetical protein